MLKVTVRADADERRESSQGSLLQGQLPRVLCVDDDPCTLSTLRRVLRARFDIVSNQEPLAALALIRQGNSFAVVISDLNMPGMTGVELLAEIRAIAPSTVGILMSADIAADGEAPLTDGVFRSLSKQCRLDALRATVAAAAEHHLQLEARGSVSARTAETARP